MEIRTRMLSAEYRISFLPRGQEVYIYLGAIWVGRILISEGAGYVPKGEYGVYLQLPEMWGPVAHKATIEQAKIAATAAIKEWLGRFAETPVAPSPALVKIVKERIHTTSVMRRVVRTRTTEAKPIRVIRKKL